MDTNFKTEIEKLKKGCGRLYKSDKDVRCGDYLLCPECQMKIIALTQAKQMVKSAIDEIKNRVRINSDARGDLDELKAKLGVQDG